MQPTFALPWRRPFGGRGDALMRVLRARARHAADRKDYRELLSFDDRILNDIGITRDMVHHEMVKPFRWTD
jgi:uncharacterized protein YjiS (DUF1127 family)